MKNKFTFLIMACLIIVCITGCQGEKNIKESPAESKNTANNEKISGKVDCGDKFKCGDLSYSVIGVRTNEYDNGAKYLILKMEAYNNSLSDVMFSAIDKFKLYGKSNEEYTLDLFADVDVRLEGQITSKNKIMGEVAFDVTDSKDESYILHIGDNYDNYKPAFNISEKDIDKTFEECFESNGVKSDYGIGDTIESKQFNVTLDSAQIKPSDKEGKELLVCEFTIKNNKTDNGTFMLGFSILGAYNSNGLKLDVKDIDVTLPVDINGNSTVTGKVPFYIETGTRDFYVTVKPDLNEFDKMVNIVFSAE
ncbi:DUF4352 domain-containing protein [Anaerovorax odorimutans]|uniref:DUF4352 domain-containing protein n=1 Tax=Anaerovorax odorimutans TaxID=109327 RepID=UPI0004204556|nr:DUF4352 domain-containing protein [Anaerovorax odorimutans]